MKLPETNDILNHIDEVYKDWEKDIVTTNQRIGYYAGARWIIAMIVQQLYNDAKNDGNLEPVFEHNEEPITNEIEASDKYIQ
jgi:hypothetical protein